MNDLKDFDFYSGYAYSYCALRLEGDGWSRQKWGEATELYKKKLKAFEIIKECLVAEFKLYEKDGEYFILFYFDDFHQLTFRLKNKEEFDLLKEVLL